MAKILNSGFSKIAEHQGSETPLMISKFVFANIPGLLPTDVIDLDQALPTLAQIVHQKEVEAFGYVASDKVVYSTILAPDEGDFYFNWVGLVTADNTLFAVVYVPMQHKYKTVGLNIGNTLTRNFLTQYQNATTITGINIPAAAWQFDFMGRLNAAEENLRADMFDFFGAGYFFGNGFQIFADGTTVKAKAGVGYVGGLRVNIPVDQVITVGALPRDIYVEAYINKTATTANVVSQFQASPASEPLNNYVDALGNRHFFIKIAVVSSTYGVTDLRNKLAYSGSLVNSLLNRNNHTGAQAISTVTGLQAALDAKLESTHASVTNAREWTAATVPQNVAEAGSDTTRMAWTAQRVRQAILAWWNSSTFKTKLDSIATGATANATDATLLARGNHTGAQAISTVTGLQGALDSKLAANHASVTNSREWTAATVAQNIAEAGSDTTRTAWTAQRVRQAILAWWNSSTFKTKLDGIATGATANATDATLLARGNHTGAQAISTVTGLQAALDAKLASTHASVTNAREWTAATVAQNIAEAGSDTTRTAWTAQRVRQAILAWWNSSTFKTKLDGIATGATANATDATLLARGNHTGAQAISTVTGLQAALNAKQNSLGFSAVQQGSGINQLSNLIKIGWSTIGKVKVTVDNTDIGDFAMEQWVNETINNKEASQGQVDSGTGNGFITPIKLLFGFEFLPGQNGYIKLPKFWKGVTFQWGLVQSNSSANTTINWNYPKHFTEVFVSIPVHSNSGVTNEKAMINAHTLTNTQTRYNLSANGIQSVRWFALGRIDDV